MKTNSWLALVLALFSLCAHAQIAIDMPVSDTDLPEIGPHHRRIETITTGYDETGNLITETNSIIQLQAGLNIWSPNEKTWNPASDEIELLNGGVDGAIARKAQYQVLFPVSLTDTNNGIIVQMPDGKVLRTRANSSAKGLRSISTATSVTRQFRNSR